MKTVFIIVDIINRTSGHGENETFITIPPGAYQAYATRAEAEQQGKEKFPNRKCSAFGIEYEET